MLINTTIAEKGERSVLSTQMVAKTAMHHHAHNNSRWKKVASVCYF
jgi:hypothetical protein